MVPGLREASKVDKSHSERNAHRLFNQFGLALRVPISSLEIPETPSQDSVTIPLLKLSDFLQHLLNKYEQLMFGGLTADASRELVGNFWSRYESHHKDHIVYTLPEEERPFCIPLMLHGDKGRSLQKSPIFVLSFQFPWGLPPAMLNKVAYDPSRSTRNVVSPRLNLPCKARAKKRAFRETDFCDCTRNDPSKFLDASSPNSHQRHNNKGHSYLSRFLISAVPAKTYKKNCNALPDLLKQVSSELKQLFRSGLTQSKFSERYRFVLIGAKGDAEWHFEAGNFNRSYHQIGGSLFSRHSRSMQESCTPSLRQPEQQVHSLPAQRMQALGLKMSAARVAWFKAQSPHAGRLLSSQALRGNQSTRHTRFQLSACKEKVCRCPQQGCVQDTVVAACRRAVFPHMGVSGTVGPLI